MSSQDTMVTLLKDEGPSYQRGKRDSVKKKPSEEHNRGVRTSPSWGGPTSGETQLLEGRRALELLIEEGFTEKRS